MKSKLRIVSGGQTGVDRAALDAALELEMPCGGWCPLGRLAEDGPIPQRYPLTETSTDHYVERTRRNVIDSNATLIVYFTTLEGGTKKTVQFCQLHHKPVLELDMADQDESAAVASLVAFMLENKVEVLNVAGPRASKQKLAYPVTKALITSVLRLI